MTQKSDEWAMQLPPPPEVIRLRWLELIERLRIGWRTVIDLQDRERQFRRNIIRWVMAEHGARRSLPTGYAVQCWQSAKHPNAIVVVRTR